MNKRLITPFILSAVITLTSTTTYALTSDYSTKKLIHPYEKPVINVIPLLAVEDF